MKKTFKSLLLVAALGSAGFVAIAQAQGGPDGRGDMMGQSHMGKMDPAKMDAMVAKRAADLKAQLKLTPEQEPAWNAFVAAMKPDAKARAAHPAREELEKLSTPERIDKMRALRDQQHSDMQAAMDKRDQATKTFYNALNAEQKKTFDAQHMRMGRDHDKRQGPARKDAKPPKAPQ